MDFAEREAAALAECLSKRRYHQARAKVYGRQLLVLTFLGLVLSASVTVMSGIQWFKSGPYGWIITVVAGLSTVVAGMLSATKVREYFLHASAFRGAFCREQFLYAQAAGPYADIDTDDKRLRLFVENVAVIDRKADQDYRATNEPPQAKTKA